MTTATLTTSTVRPRVWVGCLHHYNDGELIGRWLPADEAGDATLDDVHAGVPHEGCEELWCFDRAYLPDSVGECSATTAQRWGDVYRTVVHERWLPILNWADAGASVEDADGVPSAEDFTERYQGC